MQICERTLSGILAHLRVPRLEPNDGSLLVVLAVLRMSAASET